MCGILAKFSGREVTEANSALSTMRHRGPDAQDSWISASGHAWLGHRRLSIVDLSDAANQPLRAGHLTLIANGEIYNAPALRRQLQDFGRHFVSGSDSEAILHGYAIWGQSVVDRLEGMFAFVIWDEDRREAFFARDRVGIKPLYYAVYHENVIIGSEATAVALALPSKPDVDVFALAYAMTLGYVPHPLSPYKGIAKLTPGCCATWSPGKSVSIRPYWTPPCDTNPDTETHLFGDMFEEVVSDHLMSDVGVGMMLSGGLDSTSVAVALSRIGRLDIAAFSLAFPGSTDRENELAKLSAQHIGLPYTRCDFDLKRAGEQLTEVSGKCDEPLAVSALLASYKISEAIAKHHKVCLAGDGGDEVFGGYIWHHNTLGSGSSPPPRRWFKNIFRSRQPRIVEPDQCKAAWSEFRSRSILHNYTAQIFPRFLPQEAAWLLGDSGITFTDDAMIEPLRRNFVSRMPLKRALQRVDLLSFCTDCVLTKVDRTSMASSLEVRVPLLDRRVIEFGLRLPVSEETDAYPKQVLREYVRNHVPDAVLSNPKRGFSLPKMEAFNWDRAVDAVETSTLVRSGIWQKDVRRLLQKGYPFREARIWTLLSIAEWADAHL